CLFSSSTVPGTEAVCIKLAELGPADRGGLWPHRATVRRGFGSRAAGGGRDHAACLAFEWLFDPASELVPRNRALRYGRLWLDRKAGPPRRSERRQDYAHG